MNIHTEAKSFKHNNKILQYLGMNNIIQIYIKI